MLALLTGLVAGEADADNRYPGQLGVRPRDGPARDLRPGDVERERT
ncbi:MAG: hypothetical protein WDO24_11625 [Pseudomonadota bacterium]